MIDFQEMPFPDDSFRMVIFDPPHLKYTGSKKEAENWQMVKYGSLPAHGWQDIIRRGFSECFRVLMPGGFLIFKWNETDIKVSQLLRLIPDPVNNRPIFGHISGKRANTHWFCFMKALKEQEQPEVDLEKAARNVYESWMGGTMDDVRRDMVELGKVLNVRK